MRWYEEGNKLVIEDIDQDAVLLLWVAQKYNIDLRILLFLFDKYGKDLWFFFYLFAGLVVKFPRVEKFLQMVKDVQAAFAGGSVRSSIGKFASELISLGRVECLNSSLVD
jgi:formiminotetrahydrofolate cyclodeaminase